MLSALQVSHYKSLFEVDVTLEELTVFIGPNGSGKSNICEVLAITSKILNKLYEGKNTGILDAFQESFLELGQKQVSLESKFWHGEPKEFAITGIVQKQDKHLKADSNVLKLTLNYAQKLLTIEFNGELLEGSSIPSLNGELTRTPIFESDLFQSLRNVKVYDFSPSSLSCQASSTEGMSRGGDGVAYALVDVLLSNRPGFDELEGRLTNLVPNIQKISLPRNNDGGFSLELIDKYSSHHIPATEISDGTLRLLGFLAALYQEPSPSIICFEEIENGVHPWLLHKIIELLQIISTEGILGQPVQIVITTHSPVLLNYLAPKNIRAVELDEEGKSQIHELPVESVRFQKTLDAYDGALGELWFTNIFGGNPE